MSIRIWEVIKMQEKKSSVSIPNKQLNFRYEVIEKIECGIELKGTEVKSIRDSLCNLKDSFAYIKNNEVIVKNIHISPYEKGNINNVNPTRDRRLLLHRLEILKLNIYLKQGGYTLIPSKIYLKGRYVKLELAVCKGKKLYDKRQSLKEKAAQKQVNAFKRIEV